MKLISHKRPTVVTARKTQWRLRVGSGTRTRTRTLASTLLGTSCKRPFYGI